MSEHGDFAELIRRVRAGQGDALAILYGKFEPFLLRVARFRLRHHPNFGRLRRDFSSRDVCQSVFRSLLEGLKEGKFELRRPEDLEGLLTTMVRFYIAAKARRPDVRGPESIDARQAEERADDKPGPDHQVIVDDTLTFICTNLSKDDWDLLMWRGRKQTWDEVSAATGGTPESVRKRYERLVKRIRTMFEGEGLP